MKMHPHPDTYVRIIMYTNRSLIDHVMSMVGGAHKRELSWSRY